MWTLCSLTGQHGAECGRAHPCVLYSNTLVRKLTRSWVTDAVSLNRHFSVKEDVEQFHVWGLVWSYRLVKIQRKMLRKSPCFSTSTTDFGDLFPDSYMRSSRLFFRHNSVRWSHSFFFGSYHNSDYSSCKSSVQTVSVLSYGEWLLPQLRQ